MPDRSYLLLCVIGYLTCCILGAAWAVISVQFWDGLSEFRLTGTMIWMLFAMPYSVILCLPGFAFARWFVSEIGPFSRSKSAFVWANAGTPPAAILLFGYSGAPATYIWSILWLGPIPGALVGLLYWHFEKPRYA